MSQMNYEIENKAFSLDYSRQHYKLAMSSSTSCCGHVYHMIMAGLESIPGLNLILVAVERALFRKAPVAPPSLPPVTFPLPAPVRQTMDPLANSQPQASASASAPNVPSVDTSQTLATQALKKIQGLEAALRDHNDYGSESYNRMIGLEGSMLMQKGSLRGLEEKYQELQKHVGTLAEHLSTHSQGDSTALSLHNSNALRKKLVSLQAVPFSLEGLSAYLGKCKTALKLIPMEF